MAQDPQKTLMKATDELVEKAATDSIDMLKQVGIRPEAYKRVVLNAINSSKDLLNCTPGTIRRSILKCAQLGLIPDGDQVAIVPYKNRKKGTLEAQVIIGYKGMLDLARQAIPGISIMLRVVTDTDEFECREGLNPVLDHVYDEDGDRCTEKNFRAAYAIAWMPGNKRPEWVVLFKKEIEYIRKTYSSATSPAWIKEYAEQAKKTAARRLGKILPIRSGLLKRTGRDIGEDAFTDEWDPDDDADTTRRQPKPAGSGTARGRGRPKKKKEPENDWPVKEEAPPEPQHDIEGEAEPLDEHEQFDPDQGDVDF